MCVVNLAWGCSLLVVGVDVGGSGVRSAVLHEDGTIGEITRITLHDLSLDGVIRAVKCAIQPYENPDVIGCGIPGFLSDEIVVSSPNLPALDGINVSSALTEALGLPVFVENDANCAVVGGARLSELNDLVVLTLGTGVGGGALINGRLLRGVGGLGAEFGHIFVGGDDRCACGALGCIEAYASGTGLVRRALEKGLCVSTVQDLVVLADANDPTAVAVFERAGRALGQGIATVINLLSPKEVWLAGGVSRASGWLEQSIHAVIADQAIAKGRDRVSIKFVGPAERLAIVGAATLAKQRADIR
jgi:glucokinase